MMLMTHPLHNDHKTECKMLQLNSNTHVTHQKISEQLVGMKEGYDSENRYSFLMWTFPGKQTVSLSEKYNKFLIIMSYSLHT